MPSFLGYIYFRSWENDCCSKKMYLQKLPIDVLANCTGEQNLHKCARKSLVLEKKRTKLFRILFEEHNDSVIEDTFIATKVVLRAFVCVWCELVNVQDYTSHSGIYW